MDGAVLARVVADHKGGGSGRNSKVDEVFKQEDSG